MLTTAANNPVLVPDVSQQKVDIVYSFTGAELLLFGAILYPGGRIPDKDASIAVVLKGPMRSIRVREKQKFLGLLWINAESEKFRSAPEYYAIATSKPLKQLVDERTAAIYELGLENLQLSPVGGQNQSTERRFERGLIELRKRKDLFADTANSVKIRGGVLYRARLDIPARVSVGHYTAETFLIQDGRVIAAATRDIEIVKSGFESVIAAFAVQWPFLYGLFAVGLSILFGWIAGLMFRRR